MIANEIGNAASMLGAGRLTKDAEIDLAVGLIMNKKIGDKVIKGDSLVTIHSNSEDISAVKEKIYEAYRISETKGKAQPLIYGVMDD